MLSAEEILLIRKERTRWPTGRGAVSESLMIVQESRGWVPDQAVEEIAAELEVSPAEVEGIATFYDLIFRKPVGRHVIFMCDGVSCRLTGYHDVLRHLSEKLRIGFGQTTADGVFTLLPAGCLGVCEQAPAMIVDGAVYGNLTPKSAEEALNDIREGRGGSSSH